MGYYSNYQLSYQQNDINIAATDELKRLSGYVWEDDQLFEAKWYNLKDNIKNIVIEYPRAKFTLSTEGEETGDLWRVYVNNGNHQTVSARVVYDDPSWYSDPQRTVSLIPAFPTSEFNTVTVKA